MKILAISLARGGSKSVPRKNIRHICGLPLIAYTISEAKKSMYITDYVVSTDDEEIQSVALQYGANAPFLRPYELSTDTATSASALQHAVRFMEESLGITYDYIVELMVTNPLKSVTDIDECIKKIIQTNAESVIAVHQLLDHHPSRIKKIVDDRIVDFCIEEILESRRQDLVPLAYIRSGSIYVMKRAYLMDKGMRYGGENSRPYILPLERAINIDTELDFRVAEIMLESHKNK